MGYNKVLINLLLHCFFLSRAFIALGDTVYLSDGKEKKGIIVEDYKDRIVISTYEGEKTLFKKNISRVFYDLTEQNLVKLGDKYMSRQEPGKAYFYYEKAHRLNPGYKEAHEKMNYVLGRLFREEERAKRREVEKREAIKGWRKESPFADKGYEKDLAKHIGMRIRGEAGSIKIKEVLKNSPALRAGLKTNDTLVSVWGRFTGYMPEDEVAYILLEESPGELKLSIDRDIILKKAKPLGRGYRNIIGGRLDMLIDGLTLVALEEGTGQRAGLTRNDLIIAIDKSSTRYMPLKDAIIMIENKNKSTLTFTVRRDITIWKGR